MGMVKMTHMNVYGPGRDPQQTLELLARLSIFDADDAGALGIATTGQKDDEYAPLLNQTIGVLKDIGADSTPGEYDGQPYDLEETHKFVNGFVQEVARRSQEKTQINAKLATYEQAKTQLYHLTGLQTSMDDIFSCRYLKVRFGRLPKDSYVKLPYYEGHSFTFREYDFDGEYYWGMYFVAEQSAEEVDRIFASLYFERIWVPDFVHGTPQDALAQILSEESEMNRRKAELENLAAVAEKDEVEKLQKIAAWLNYESQIAQMYRHVVLLDNSYYISGFVPEEQTQRLRDAVAKELPEVRVCADEELGTETELDEKLKPPTKLKNNWLTRPFELFVTMYGLPNYGDIDPTGLVAVTYAVLFGFLYGSVFGFENLLDPMYHALGFAEKPLEVLHPESINMILITSIVAGIFIIVCAIGTGIISNFRRRVIAKTLFSVNGVAGLVFYLALVCLLLPMLGVQASFIGSVPYIVLLIVIPFLCMYFCEPLCLLFEGKHPGKPGEIIINGFFEMFDALLSFASNTMSFLRVGGFVLAHAGMMSVVFTLANMTTQPVIYWIIVVIGNLFVMALEGLFVGIQVLRLEFYEIFSRFFDAEGRPFTPLHVRSGKELLES